MKLLDQESFTKKPYYHKLEILNSDFSKKVTYDNITNVEISTSFISFTKDDKHYVIGTSTPFFLTSKYEHSKEDDNRTIIL